MSKFFIYTLTLLISFSTESSFADNTSFEKGVAKASIVLGISDVVNASVETIVLPNDYAYSKAYTWGGDETSPPKRIIKTITISRNGQAFFIPLSTYADLANPRNLLLEKLPAHGFRLIINGGDAAGSYSAMLDFKKNEIFRRKVVSGEFPKEAWEETTFAFNHLSN
ncbi:hypothetical protein NUH87_06175 [Pseudomonas batumici]|uniref:hypothetical protein n=1 Tax=Pseudomonas batumici TaxID=226910 RepID=UPI0030CAF876